AERAGLTVRIKERDDDSVGRALSHVRRLLDQQVRKRRLDRRGLERVLARISATTDLSGFHRADVIVEAVPEELELKRQLLAEVEAATTETCIFASNTSSLPIARIAEGAGRPGNVIGMHYFSPVEKLPLLEVIPHRGTDPSVIATCVELGKKQGKTVIVVGDGVGFDTGEKVSHVLHEAFGERMTPPQTMGTLIKQGRLGKKVKKGFYRYDVKGKPVDTSVYESVPGGATRVPFPEEELRERPVLLFLNEA